MARGLVQPAPAADPGTGTVVGDPAGPPRHRRKRLAGKVAAYLVLGLVAFFALVPFTWMILAAFDSSPNIFVRWPEQFTFDNFVRLVTVRGGLRLVVNSLIYSVGATAVIVFVTVLAGYALSRFSFPGRRAFMLGILLTRVLPPAATIAPLYVIIAALGLLNTYHGMILVLAAMEVPLVLWLMKGFFDTIPIEIEEAAWVDGASRLQSAFRIVLPLAGPGVAAGSLIGFVGAWQEFLIPLVMISDSDRLPISIGIFRAWVSYTQVDWGFLAALSVIYVLPAMVFYMIARRALQESMAGGLKGT